MYVTVALKIEIDARASLGKMESQIQQAGREVMKEGLKQAFRHIEEQEKTCPHCGSERVPAARNEAQGPGFPVSDGWKCH
jgi:hypothetical protein